MDSGFQVLDSRYLTVQLGFWIPNVSAISDLLFSFPEPVVSFGHAVLKRRASHYKLSRVALGRRVGFFELYSEF